MLEINAQLMFVIETLHNNNTKLGCHKFSLTNSETNEICYRADNF